MYNDDFLISLGVLSELFAQIEDEKYAKTVFYNVFERFQKMLVRDQPFFVFFGETVFKSLENNNGDAEKIFGKMVMKVLSYIENMESGKNSYIILATQFIDRIAPHIDVIDEENLWMYYGTFSRGILKISDDSLDANKMTMIVSLETVLSRFVTSIFLEKKEEMPTKEENPLEKLDQLFSEVGISEKLQHNLRVYISVEQKKKFDLYSALLQNSKEISVIEPDILLKMGNFAFYLNDFNRSEEYYLNALKSEKKNELSYFNLSTIFVEQGKYKDAIEHLQLFLEKFTSDADAWHTLGICYFMTGNIEKAIESYKKTIDLGKDHYDAMHNMGIALATQGNFEEAIRYFKKVVDAQPKHASAWYNLGVAYADNNAIDESISCFKSAIESDENMYGAWNNLGVAYAKKGKYNDAVDSIAKATKIKPDYAEAWNIMGLIFETKLRNLGEARRCYQKALKIEPNNKNYLRNLSNVI